tara:strand:- start:6906 stop:7307 length:402 start_codon:yes stop_codon:yes gene_type:complete
MLRLINVIKKILKMLGFNFHYIVNEVEAEFKKYTDELLIFTVNEVDKIKNIITKDVKDNEEIQLGINIINKLKNQPINIFHDAIKTINENSQNGKLDDVQIKYNNNLKKLNVKVMAKKISYDFAKKHMEEVKK